MPNNGEEGSRVMTGKRDYSESKKRKMAHKIVSKILDRVDEQIAATENVTFRDWIFTDRGLQEFEYELTDDVLRILEEG